jgi:chromosomal replication initiation ATPase DnaA
METAVLSSPAHQETKPKSFHDIKREVCHKYGITLADMDGDRKFKKFVEARGEAWWRGRYELKKSYLWLAFYSGQKDHTTVIHGVKRHEKKLSRASQNAKGDSKR